MEVVLWCLLVVVAWVAVAFFWSLKESCDQVEREWPEMERRYQEGRELERRNEEGRW